MEAKCQCGQLAVRLPGPTPAIVACHCLACQRRTGSPFGVLAYYPAEAVTIAGEAARYDRPTDAGGVFESYFCGVCGSTVYVRAAKHPTLIGVAVGAVADPAFPAPVRSVWEESMHGWVAFPSGIERFAGGRPTS